MTKANKPAPVSAIREYWATLVRGDTYTLRGVQYERGKKKRISAAIKAKLEASAIDRSTITHSDQSTEPLVLQKFKFEAIEGGTATVAVKSKADELAEMQGDGGVEFEEGGDEGDTDTSGLDEGTAAEGDDTDETPPPAPRRSRASRN